MRFAALVGLSACSFSQRLVPTEPSSVSVAPITVTLESVEASPIKGQLGVWVTVETDGTPAVFDGTAAQLEVNGEAADYSPPPPDASGSGVRGEIIASVINSIAASREARRVRCEVRSRCRSRVMFELPDDAHRPADVYLRLDDAITASGAPVKLPPLRVTTRTEAGLRNASSLSSVFGMRFGGGVTHQARGFGSTLSFDLEAYGGVQRGPVALVAMLAFGMPLVLGADVRYTVERDGYNLVGFAGFGWYEHVMEDYGEEGGVPQGAGVRLGGEINLRTGDPVFGAATRDSGIGFYLYVAPAFYQEGPSWTVNGGLNAGFF
jgi:hypothetical protein